MKGNKGTQKNLLYFILIAHALTLKINMEGDCSHEIKRCLLPVRIAMTNLDSVLKKQTHHFANKGPYSQGYGFSSSHVWM